MYFEDNSEQVRQAMLTAARRAMEVVGASAETWTKSMTPVDTGTLRNSYTHVVEEGRGQTKATIGTNVEYAPYVELGTRKMNSRPHLRPAIANHLDEYAAIIQSNMRQA